MTAFLALLRRDLVVASRNASLLILSALTQPILVILVFGNIMPRLGLVAPDLGTVMVPGLMAIAILMAGVQGVLIPLVQDLSGSREVDERILAPLSILGVAIEKVVAGAIHSALRRCTVGACHSPTASAWYPAAGCTLSSGSRLTRTCWSWSSRTIVRRRARSS